MRAAGSGAHRGGPRSGADGAAAREPAGRAGGDDGYLFLDLRGLQAMYGDLATLEAAIRAAVPRAASAPVRFRRGQVRRGRRGAHRPSRARRARCRPQRDGAFLAPLSVRHLLLLEPEVLQRLELLGLRTIGDLAALPFSAVQAEFGPPGAQAWRLAHGTTPSR